MKRIYLIAAMCLMGTLLQSTVADAQTFSDSKDKPFDKAEWLRLEKKADELRRLCLQTAIWGGSGHLGGALSSIDIMTILYHRFMSLDLKNPE